MTILLGCVTVSGMGNPAGVKRDFEALERRRLRAARLLKKGLPEAEVARQVGVHRQSVNRWARQLAESGPTGLKKAGRPGRKPRLTDADLRRIERGLKQGPEALGYSTSLWTAKRAAVLITQICGVRFHLGHVWRLLGEWAGVANGQPVGPWSGLRPPSAGGSSRAGRSLKKKPRSKASPSSSSTRVG